MRTRERVAYFKICAVKIIFLSQAVCGRAHIVKGADEIGQNRLIRPFVVSGNFIDLRSRGWLVCGRLACGMDLHVAGFTQQAAGGLNFSLDS